MKQSYCGKRAGGLGVSVVPQSFGEGRDGVGLQEVRRCPSAVQRELGLSLNFLVMKVSLKDEETLYMIQTNYMPQRSKRFEGRLV